ncbi:hypothetical protein K432DRAFT_384898 [Lepidopterella palustris CBS 459.81]|uniref:Uncharacterized protein n=1 Tax=Lepidopterella palustris CBS 459.81 TaxID=1314670 RepID=A0A8E2JCB4_9PEZI|nr:hypothetical protein K432DRAFT_384898 [Lepidopterella palustris CBS 459.81]
MAGLLTDLALMSTFPCPLIARSHVVRRQWREKESGMVSLITLFYTSPILSNSSMFCIPCTPATNTSNLPSAARVSVAIALQNVTTRIVF